MNSSKSPGFGPTPSTVRDERGTTLHSLKADVAPHLPESIREG
jgi:hypothetical protein